MIADRRAFILAHTRLQPPPHTPELKLHLAGEETPLWRLGEAELEALGLSAPFWAFAWAGGQGLARWVLDHPEIVAGRSILDFAAGSGIAAVAAMKAGAAGALAADIDGFCGEAVALNAEVNGVAVAFTDADLLAAPPPRADVILAGDVCYEAPLTARVLAWLAAARAGGARVLIGDPGRTYFPKSGLVRLAEYQVPVTRALEDMEVRRTGVWEMP
ncbi:MAG: methyltransferase [Caulobacteraceae bacterium]|nr:methyltransferase [Caulobacteraceae bacterium]